MNWTRMLKRYGYQVEEAGVEYDPFLIAGQPKQEQETARISVTVGSSREYGEVKCGVSISISCPQNERSINMATEMAFRKAVELTNDGASQLEIPQLPPFQEP